MSGESVRQRAQEFFKAKGIIANEGSVGFEALAAFAESESSLARKQEREECAKLAETHEVMHGDHYASYAAPSNDGKEIAAAIRSRGGDSLKGRAE